MGLNRLIGGFESVDGSVWLIVGSSDGGFSGDFFFYWVCSGGVALVLVWFWFWFLFSHLPSLTL